MRLNLLLILPVLLSQLPALGQSASNEPQWLKIADNKESTTFLNTNYLEKQGIFRLAQTYELLKTVGADGTTQQITKYRFRCDRRLGTVESIVKFNSSNKPIDYVVNDEIDKLTPVVQQSIAGAVFNYACASSR